MMNKFNLSILTFSLLAAAGTVHSATFTQQTNGLPQRVTAAPAVVGSPVQPSQFTQPLPSQYPAVVQSPVVVQQDPAVIAAQQRMASTSVIQQNQLQPMLPNTAAPQQSLPVTAGGVAGTVVAKVIEPIVMPQKNASGFSRFASRVSNAMPSMPSMPSAADVKSGFSSVASRVSNAMPSMPSMPSAADVKSGFSSVASRMSNAMPSMPSVSMPSSMPSVARGLSSIASEVRRNAPLKLIN